MLSLCARRIRGNYRPGHKGQIRSPLESSDCVSRSDLLRETDLAKLPQSLSRQVMILYGLILHETFLSG